MYDIEDTRTLTKQQIFVCHVDTSVLLGQIPDQNQDKLSVCLAAASVPLSLRDNILPHSDSANRNSIHYTPCILTTFKMTLSKPTQRKMSSKASVKTTTKLYDFLENDSSMQVMTVTLLSSILIISTVMLVLVIVAVATFRSNTFNI